MSGKTVRLSSDGDRWLELTVGPTGAFAIVGSSKGPSEPFSFGFENLGFVLLGIGYQAWGSGSYFTFRRRRDGFTVEFGSQTDRSSAICHLATEELKGIIDDLEPLNSMGKRVAVL